MVLKIYNDSDRKSYIKEIIVLKKIEELRITNPSKVTGFPTLISCIEGASSAEILMETIGPNLRKQLKDTQGGVFSRATVYQITIQMVSFDRMFFTLVDQPPEDHAQDGVRAQ